MTKIVFKTSAGMLTALTVTAMSLMTPAFASKKYCDDNGDNNCNTKHNTQKPKAKNDCEIENVNKEHSHDNQNLNGLVCINQAANVRDSLFVNSSVCGDPFSGLKKVR